MRNEVINTILTRSSIRAYKPNEIDPDKLETLKEAALAAPTAMDKQEQRFAFVTDRAVLSDIESIILKSIVEGGDNEFAERIKARGGKIMYDAPLVVFICAPKAKFAAVNAGIAVENIAIAAKSMGLDSVILGMPALAFEGGHALEIKQKLGFSQEYEFMIAIAVGAPAMDKTPHEWNMSHIINI